MNLYQKMLAVMQAVQYLSKDDSIEYKTTKYKAISEEKVTSAVRAELVKQGIVIFPIKQEHKKESQLTTVNVTYRMVNAEKPDDFIDVVSSGTGADTQDKGVGKAMTYAYKYMLLRTFAIPTGEDTDKTSSQEIEDKMKQKEAERNEAELKKPITESQIKELRLLFEKERIDEAKVCCLYKVDDISELTNKMYNNAVQHKIQLKRMCSV